MLLRTHKIQTHYSLVAVFGLAAFTTCCGQEKGGDHIPETGAYEVDEPSLPPESTTPNSTSSTAVGPTPLSSVGSLEADYLRPFLHISEQYYICLDASYFNADQVAAADAYVDKKGENASLWGLEPALNLTLASVDQFRNSRQQFSSRLELQVVSSANGRCDLVITRASASKFPFNEDEFSDSRLALLQRGRVNVGSKKNRIPILYLKDSEPTAVNNALITSGIATYLGMKFSSRVGSPLNPDSADGSPQWEFISGRGSIMVGNHESFAMFGFALFYQDILKPADLDRIHHYQDQLGDDGSLPTDPDLNIPLGSVAATYTEAIGKPYIHGAVTQSAINVCLTNQSSKTLQPDWPEKYLSFTKPQFQGGIVNILQGMDPQFSPQISLAEENCQLLVVIRDQTSFPFAELNFNGLFAKAGSVKDGSATPSTIPVIYLNASNLEFNPDLVENSDLKYAQLVLRHEFAHFLGFKHSPSADSILSPSGYNQNWDFPGDDAPMFDEFLRHWSANKNP